MNIKSCVDWQHVCQPIRRQHPPAYTTKLCYSRKAGFWAGGFSTLSPPPSPRALCQPSTRPRPGGANPWWRPHYEFQFFQPSNYEVFFGNFIFVIIVRLFCRDHLNILFQVSNRHDNKILQMECYLSHNLSLLAMGMNTFQLQQHLNISVIAISLYQMYSRDTRWKEQKRKVAAPWGNKSMTTCVKFTKELQDKWLLTFRESSKLGEQSVFPVLQP